MNSTVSMTIDSGKEGSRWMRERRWVSRKREVADDLQDPQHDFSLKVVLEDSAEDPQRPSEHRLLRWSQKTETFQTLAADYEGSV